MKKIVSVCIIDFSDRTINALKRNSINTLHELLTQRDLGLLSPMEYDGECLRELHDVCNKIDSFKASLKKSLFPNDSRSFLDDKKREFISPLRKKQSKTGLKDAVMELFNKVPTREFNNLEIQEILKKVFLDDYSEDLFTIGSVLAELANEKKIESLGSTGYYKLVKDSYNGTEVIYSFDKMAKLRLFLDEQNGKEIEFRYKTERSRSDKRWRRARIYSQDDRCLYTTDCYPSGRRIYYLKERIVEYRAVKE